MPTLIGPDALLLELLPHAAINIAPQTAMLAIRNRRLTIGESPSPWYVPKAAFWPHRAKIQANLAHRLLPVARGESAPAVGDYSIVR
jgi:hypothetical protein